MSGGPNRPTGIERLLTVDEVAAILGVSKRTVIRMLGDGRLKKVKSLGRSVRIHPRALRRLEGDE